MKNILLTLKMMKIWLCWRFVEKDGKRTKVPVSASGKATGTNEKYIETWVTYDEAKVAATDKNFGGIGFVIPSGYFFIDIDHRSLEDPFVKELLERFNSYTEYSVSGEGVHIYGLCDLTLIPTVEKNGELKLDSHYYQKNPHNGVELYIGGLTNRFAVFTGNSIIEEPLKECTDAVLLTLEKDMIRPVKNVPKNKNSESAVRKNGTTSYNQSECEKIIKILRTQKNASKFSKLFDNGDTSDYASHSEADLALCCIIAFRAGNNPGLIDAVFRRSALYTEKGNFMYA